MKIRTIPGRMAVVVAMPVFAIAVDPDGAQGNPPQLNIIVLHW